MQINAPEVLAELGAIFERYEAALVGNEVENLDALFWPSNFTVRFGTGENLYGIAAIRAFRSARSAAGLARSLQHTVITTFGSGFGTTSTEFRRAGSALVGRQQQTWVRLPELGWRVVAAHVSLIPEPAAAP
ncbi:MAG: oxalurate catabolism protein HpxZ [Pseudomonadota bacterium]|jgi:hypothetical protein